jgi:cysteine desulfurase
VTRAYLDHASTSPLRPEARTAMVAWLDRPLLGDPSRLHADAMGARAAVEVARAQVAALVGARPREVVFCSGATEAIATACHGASTSRPGRSVLAAVEHSAVREWASKGPVDTLLVDRAGRIELDTLPADGDGVSVVHVQWGNHEVATLQPVLDATAWCRANGVLGHVDAAQAVGRVPVDFGASGADLMSVSSHKFGGPLGVGALLVRRGLRLDPLLVGGDQERARRAGIENVPAIVGFGAAAAGLDVVAEAARNRAQTDRALAGALAVDGVTAYGAQGEGRVPHLVCMGVGGVESEAVLLGLDQAGVAAHSGSACSSEALEPSPVLEAMGVDADRSLRVSVGWSTTDADIDTFTAAFPTVVERLRALR